jgi:hypothetical protein
MILLLRFLLFFLALLILLFTSGPVASQPDDSVALIGATGSAALDAVRARVDGLALTNWWEAAQADAVTPLRLVIFDPATLDDAALRWSWQAYERGVVFVGIGASYAEMRYVTGGFCTARGAALPVNLPDTHAIVFYLPPDAEPDAIEADLRGCVLPEGDFPPRGLGLSEGILTAPLDAAGLDVLMETVGAALGEG